jgi:diguanylate cyclase (GGDEF)-like protein
MPASISKQVKEFFAAAGQPFSYNLRRNIYIWFGILWGLPIPLVTVLMHGHFLSAAGIAWTFGEVLATPLQWFFLAHPLLFGMVFGILGTIRNDKEKKIKEMVGKLEEMSIHDPLTGLKNRRYFAHIFHDECAGSLRRREALTLLFLDLDHFKKVNDDHGHHFGDLALQQTSRYHKEQCRPYDTVVRWGGEEFIILLRATDEPAAISFSERIREGIETEVTSDLPFSLTISIGLAQYQDNDTLETLTGRADQALYHAKQTGRNQVVPWSKLSSTADKGM